MGSVNLDNTGSGSAITLSSDGTSLLLNGTAIGGSPDLYGANASSATDPTASGANAVAIGDDAVASGVASVAFGQQTDATGTNAIALGSGAQATQPHAVAIRGTASARESTAIGVNNIANGAVAAGEGSMALQGSYASGADSFAAAIATNSSSYGALGDGSIAMGYQAKASGGYGAVAIGRTAQVAMGSNTYSAVALGQSYASGGHSFAAGGANSSSSYGAKGNNSIAIGSQSMSQGTSAFALGSFAQVYSGGLYGYAIGRDTTVSNDYSYALGYTAKTRIDGQFAFASGKFAANGDAQGGLFVLRADTTDATATALTTDNGAAGSTNQIVAASDTCITFDGTITAMQNGAQAYGSWRIEGLLVNDGGTTTLANSATTVIHNLSSWGMALSADNTNNALSITCTGEASHNIRWVANIRTTEVTYA